MNKPTFAQDIAEMMKAWDTIVAAARKEFHGVSEEQIYQISHAAMKATLGL